MPSINSVSARLGLGFAFMIVLLTAVAWQGWQGVLGVGRKADEVAGHGAAASELARALTLFSTARVMVRDFMWNATPETAERSGAQLAEARDAMRTVPVSGEYAARILSLHERLGEWGQSVSTLQGTWRDFNQTVEQRLFPLATENVGLVHRLAERYPGEPRVVALAMAFLDGRGLVVRYLHRGDPQYIAPAQAALARARDLALVVAQSSRLDEPGVQALRSAAESIDRYAAIHLEVTRLRIRAEELRVAALNVLGPAIRRDGEALWSELAQRAQSSRAEAEVILYGTTWRLVVFSAIAGLLGLLLAGFLSRSVTGPLTRLRGTIARIAAGDTTTAVSDQARSDELGAIARALEGLRGMVGLAYERQQMVEQLPMGVMMTDPRDDFRITYMNPRSAELLKPMEHLMPVKTDELVGRSVDILHRNPGHQRAILADPSRLPHKARIKLGDEVLDLTISAVRDRQGEYVAAMLSWNLATAQARLADCFEADVGAVIEGLASTAAQVEQASASLSGSAKLSGERAGDVAQAGRAAGADVQSVAASAEELASSVVEITRQVAEGAQVARAAAEEARATNATVEGLAQAAARINDVVRLIGDIAGQTNLLALNATIEAARAGEAGKGFAVVASEVKALASQTARATEEIGGQIAAVQKAADGAVGALRSIGGTVARMEEVTSAIAAAVEEQGAATREIARSAASVAGSTDSVVARIDEVRQGTDETGRAAGGLVAAASEMTAQTAALRAKSSSFLASVRAA